jgi:alpha-beta hydrolase superfamily lysophospholipase
MSITEPRPPAAASWQEDLLGEGYRSRVFDLGDDPDGEGRVEAVLVRREVRTGEQVNGVALYVHGFSDYFFQTALADFCAERGLAFYALDLRKSGRARRPGQTAHYVSDLKLYDAELEASLEVMGQEWPGLPVTILAHSTGGLIVPLWLNRRRREKRVAPVAGVVLNSPWFDLQGTPTQRGPATWAIRGLSKVQPLRAIPLPTSTVYGGSLHTSMTGEWDFELELKPLAGFPITVGWLNAVRRGHAELHRGLDIGVPSLLLRSDRSYFELTYSPAADSADSVLDVRQIARWAGCLGNETTIVPIPGARHDVLLSRPEPREHAYQVLHGWLAAHPPAAVG